MRRELALRTPVSASPAFRREFADVLARGAEKHEELCELHRREARRDARGAVLTGSFGYSLKRKDKKLAC